MKDTTPTNCVYADKGASQGTKLFYNASKVSLVSQGSLALPVIRATDNPRYLAWGIFTQKSTNKKFFVGDAHLEPGSGTDLQDLRTRQTQAITAEVKRAESQQFPRALDR